MAAVSDIPVLSFPAILRNPGLTDRYAHLRESAAGHAPNQQSKTTFRKKHKYDNEGKRWIRRKDNARFVGNPHIVLASKRDYILQTPHAQSTFPEPLPAYLPRTVKLPTAPCIPGTDPNSANAGRFSLSLKGMRRDLRKAGGRAEALVKDVESEMVQWLGVGGTVLFPNGGHAGLEAVGTPVGTTGSIFEVSRTPLQLIWRITDDAFARFVVHCCARYHEIVSFSKGNDEHRLTYLLRPNVTRPDRIAQATLETPPVTDIDYSSNPETEDYIDSDFVSDRDMESDAELDGRHGSLARIDESPASVMAPLPPLDEDVWSHLGDEGTGGESEADEFDSGSEFGTGLEASVDILQPRLEALSLQSSPPAASILESQTLPTGSPFEVHSDPDATVTEIRPHRLIGSSSPRRRDWTSSARSPSSPSRSPVRTRPSRRRLAGKKRTIVVGVQGKKTFYEYLFM
ncbi:hypothetical protein CPB84DRAFT_1775131 [Gymnopilus junonius]|uniref:Uncharacterized protein n=1 Tax=Gymnopilus junonius TaxID=109634 RepID=A0A9P5NQH3_GYMJU|nr:hypothetical protein CPB84DRAFT_1775131 [Gymnopilus junonius]